MSDSRLIDAATSILDYYVTELASEGVDVPQRQYTHAGLVAADFAGPKCADALIVSWLGTTQGQVGVGAGSGFPQAPIRCAMPLSHQFIVVLLRCVPTLNQAMKAPSPADLTASSEQILTDAMTMAKITVDGALNKMMVPQDPFSLTGIGQLVPVGPSGGVGGTQMSIWVTLY